jgi:replicative DNA helicase
LQALEKPSISLGEYRGDDEIISSHEMMIEFQEKPESIINVKSSIRSLDRWVDGFRDGELIVISGPTKNGKTLLAQSLTVAFCRQQYTPLWFSFEVPTRQFLNQFRELPLIYMPRRLKAHALQWFKERCEESFVKYHTRIIFIDHLHYLIDLARLRNPSIEIGQIIRQLKTLAVQKECLIFLLCHTTKGASDPNINYESIRDSSFISQESDCVMMIKRTPEDGETAARLRIEFHRRTGILEKVVRLTKHDGYLMEAENDIDSRTGGLSPAEGKASPELPSPPRSFSGKDLASGYDQ